jgi:hypothetical protein
MVHGAGAPRARPDVPPELLDLMRHALAAYRQVNVTTEVLSDITHQLQA